MIKAVLGTSGEKGTVINKINRQNARIGAEGWCSIPPAPTAFLLQITLENCLSFFWSLRLEAFAGENQHVREKIQTSSKFTILSPLAPPTTYTHTHLDIRNYKGKLGFRIPVFQCAPQHCNNTRLGLAKLPHVGHIIKKSL